MLSARDGKLRARSRPPGVFVSRGIVCVIRWFVRAHQGICKQKSKQTGESRAVNCPASFGKYVPIDGRKYTGKFYSQNRSLDDGTAVRHRQTLGVKVKSERHRADCRLFTEIFPTIICPGGLPREIRKGADAEIGAG